MGVTPLFELRGVNVTRERPILIGISVVFTHPVTLITGPSGSGKTTFLRLLNGLDSPTSGTVTCRGKDLTEWKPRELRRTVGFVAQETVALAPTVQAELELASQIAGVELGPAVDEARVRLEIVDAMLAQSPKALSVGERQRLGIVRALAAEPQILVMDEPTSAQDDARALAVHELLADRVQSGLRIIVVEHRTEAIAAHPDVRRIALSAGRIV